MKRCKNVLRILISILCLLIIAPAVQAVPYARLELPASPIIVGNSFNVDVKVDGVDASDGILAFGFDVSYLSSVFSYNGAVVASPFTDDSLFNPNADVAGIYFSFDPPTGNDILLASLNFTALAAANTLIGVYSDMHNPSEGLFKLLDSKIPQIPIIASATLEVSPVPIPSTLLLLGSGLFGFMCFGKKESLLFLLHSLRK